MKHHNKAKLIALQWDDASIHPGQFGVDELDPSYEIFTAGHLVDILKSRDGHDRYVISPERMDEVEEEYRYAVCVPLGMRLRWKVFEVDLTKPGLTAFKVLQEKV